MHTQKEESQSRRHKRQCNDWLFFSLSAANYLLFSFFSLCFSTFWVLLLVFFFAFLKTKEILKLKKMCSSLVCTIFRQSSNEFFSSLFAQFFTVRRCKLLFFSLWFLISLKFIWKLKIHANFWALFELDFRQIVLNAFKKWLENWF